MVNEVSEVMKTYIAVHAAEQINLDGYQFASLLYFLPADYHHCCCPHSVIINLVFSCFLITTIVSYFSSSIESL